MKRKLRSTTNCRKRKCSKPRSRDSGVSCKFNDDKNVQNSNAMMDMDNVEGTDISLKESCNMGDTAEYVDSQRSDQKNILAPLMENNLLTLNEDENFLDYEPSEDEVNNNASSPIDEKSYGKLKIIDEQKNQNIFVNPRTTNRNNEFNSSNSAASVAVRPDPSFLFSNNPGGANIEDEMCKSNDENMALKNFQNDDFNSNEQTECYDEIQADPCNYSFGNAKVKFNGPLNITITRPATNNSQSKVSSQNLSNLSMVRNQNSPNVKILNITALVPEEEKNINEHLKDKKRARMLPTDISNYNVECSKQSIEDEINSDYNRFSNMSSHTDLTEREHQNTSSSSNTSLGSYSINDQNKPVECYRPQNFREGNESELQQISVGSEEMSPFARDEFKQQGNYKEHLVAKWLMHNGEDYFVELLDSLCESHFTTSCKDLRCLKLHSLEEFKKIIQQLTPQELNKFYKIVLKKDVWFMWLFDIFLDHFTVTPNVDEIMLIDMIDDVYKVFNGTFIDKTSYIVKIVESLNRIGFPFKQAIKRIILRYGTSQLWICDILLFLIAKRSNLEDHWCLVQKITCCRRERIDHEVVTELLIAASKNYPPNKELYKKIYNDIFKKNLVDLGKIPCHLRETIIEQSGNHTLGLSYRQDSNVSNNLDLEEQQRKMMNFSEIISPCLEDPTIIQENWKASLESPHGLYTENGDDLFFEQGQKDEKLELYRPEKDKTWTSADLTGINERVLRKVVESRNSTQTRHIPANIIAHPSCQPIIDPCYQCNVSLHNHFPGVHGWVTAISTSDLRRLKNSLMEMDVSEFLDVLNSYSIEYTIENFIVTVLTLLKSAGKMSEGCSMFISLINALEEKDPEYMNKIHIKISIEVLALNMIYMLHAKGKILLCRNILLKVKDWHNLVTSKIFLHKSKLQSHMKRYIYLINVLLLAEDFNWVNEIFQSEVLNLLGPSSTWPFSYEPSDTEARNKALKSFFERGFAKNIFITNDLLKSIAVMQGGSVEGFDVWTWFNNKILTLMEEEGSRSILLFLSNDITNHYEKYMDKFVLQAYMLHMKNSIKSKEALQLFKLCCNKGIYHKYTGEEDVVYVTTNLTDFEITSLLHCYLDNLRCKRVPSHGFHIELVLPEGVAKASEIIEKKFRTYRNVYKVFESICSILESKYDIVINQPIHSRIYVPIQYSAEAQIYN